jgi:hypothetical protein
LSRRTQPPTATFTTGSAARAASKLVDRIKAGEKASIDWAETPATGTSTKGLKYPAVLLEINDAGAAAHQH